MKNPESSKVAPKLTRTKTDLLSIGPIVNNNIWIVNNIR